MTVYVIVSRLPVERWTVYAMLESNVDILTETLTVTFELVRVRDLVASYM